MKLEDITVTMSSTIMFPPQNRRAVQQQVTCLAWNIPEGNYSQQTKFFPTRSVSRGMGQLRKSTPLGHLLGGNGVELLGEIRHFSQHV